MKNKKTTAILAFFLGGIGVHRFYLGQTGKGVLSILFCWTFIPSVIGLYDCIFFSFMSKEYFEVTYNNNLNLHCSACKTQLLENTTSYWGLGENNGACKNCFQKIRNHSKESGNYKFEDNEVQKIINGEIDNRPLPKSVKNTFHIPENDFLEEVELPEEFETIKLNSLAQIAYKDAQGQKSERRITMYSINPTIDDDYMIKAYCHERNAQRTFKLSRITELTDIETGEVFDNPEKYFLDRFNESPIGIITNVFQELESEILVLTFVARADGYLRKKEREIIIAFLVNKSNMDFDLDLLENEIRRTYCESKDFREALKQLSKKTIDERTTIMDLAISIVNTDKNPDPMELGALELIKKELKLEKASA
ncbi:NINE protein [Salegentibacter flavus]|uniref:TM2 domain-containing membrane protein YozV n=1 Tax=Salegentibacter flavus TaxID=287099 RepID=A0A1I5DK38_9FLAO|nr:NINE protein [Salegentibacter flavus]SFN99151.1 TM2 domain-containing membrane protein YozV [Salegentibacter flavus]